MRYSQPTITVLLTCLILALTSCSPRSRIPTESPPDPVVEAVPVIEIELPIGFGVATENRVRVRAEAGIDAEALGHLYQRDPLEILDLTDEPETIGEHSAVWYRIRTPLGLEGWAFGAFIEETDEEVYRDSYRRLTIGTVNLPWEPGELVEDDILRGDWGPEWGDSGLSIDFSPDGVTAAGGNALEFRYVSPGIETTLSGVWRVKNGYLVTEILADQSVHSEVLQFVGFALWQIRDIEDSLFTTRELVTVQRTPAVAFSDRNSRVSEGSSRVLGNLVVVAAGLRSVELSGKVRVRPNPDTEAVALEFAFADAKGRMKAQAFLPDRHRAICIARIDGWYFIDTLLEAGATGPATGWVSSEAVDG